MAYFAQLNENNVVTRVIVVNDDDTSDSNGVVSENIGIGFCEKTFGADTNWKQTTYDGNIRGNYAGIGLTYMENVATLGVGSTDIFIEQQPYASWTIGVNTAQWYPPIARPDLSFSQVEEGYCYEWDEAAYQADNTVGWVLTTSS